MVARACSCERRTERYCIRNSAKIALMMTAEATIKYRYFCISRQRLLIVLTILTENSAPITRILFSGKFVTICHIFFTKMYRVNLSHTV